MIVDWLKSYYNNQNISGFNAALSATDSKFGVFRLNNHLLDKDDYDLIFVEFAVNDGDGSSSNTEKSMEGIVRKIWQKNPNTDICFVYTLKSSFLTDINAGKMNQSTSKMDSIASYYKIPSICWGVECAKMLASDTVVFYATKYNYLTSKNSSGQWVFTQDNTHPSTFGHSVYTNVLSKNLKKIDNIAETFYHEIKPALLSDNYENSKMIPFQDADNHGMSVITTTNNDSMDDFINSIDNYINKFGVNYLASSDVNNYYSFSFLGREFGISELYGPSTGNFVVEVDGTILSTVKTFLSSANGYRFYPVYFTLSKDELHTVKLYPSVKQYSLAQKDSIFEKGGNTSGRTDLAANPYRYEMNNLLFSHIFIVGDYIFANPTEISQGLNDNEISVLIENNYIIIGSR